MEGLGSARVCLTLVALRNPKPCRQASRQPGSALALPSVRVSALPRPFTSGVAWLDRCSSIRDKQGVSDDCPGNKTNKLKVLRHSLFLDGDRIEGGRGPRRSNAIPRLRIGDSLRPLVAPAAASSGTAARPG